MSEIEQEEDVAALFDLSTKKKKKSKKVEKKVEVPVEQSTTVESSKASSQSSSSIVLEEDPPTFSYSQLLDRIVDTLNEKNPELTDKKRYSMKPPQLMRGL
jgi:translation initiation factor 2 subunit 2